MKGIFIFLLILLVAQMATGEVDFDIDTKIFIPPVYYIGDKVELRIKIKIISEPVEIIIPEKLPSEQWIEINKVSYINFPSDAITLNIFFKGFKPGKHILPILSLGDIELDGIEINIQSITEEMESQRINPFRPQIELPGTQARIILLLIFFIVLPIGLFLAIRYLRYFMKKMQGSKEKEYPRNYISKALQHLIKTSDSLNSKDFYTQLATIIRNYIEKRFLIPALTLTTRELKKFFENSIEEKILQSKLIRFSGILFFADLIKFSKKESSHEEKLANVDAILIIVNLIEKEPAVVKS